MTKNLFLLFFLMSFNQLVAQPWSDLLNPTDPNSSNIPKYRQMMENIDISWYDVEEEYRKYWANQNRAPSEEEGGSEFERYLEFMKSNSDENGLYQPMEREQAFWDKINQTRVSQAESGTANWTAIGPDIIDGDGDLNNSRMHSIYQDPTNSNILLTGGGTAGIWKSTDGGSNWTNISMGMEKANSIDAVLPDRTDANHIIIASRNQGLFRTTNGGTTWVKSTDIPKTHDIIQHPSTSTTWFAGAKDGFYKSTDNGVSWTASFSGGEIHDIEMHPTNPLILYILEESDDVNNENQRIYKSIDGGANFSLLTTDLPADSDGDFSRAEIAVTPAAPDNLYAVYAEATSNGLYGIYVSTDAGVSFTLKCCGGSVGGSYSNTNLNILGYSPVGTTAGGQLNYQQSLYVSPTDANTLFSGGVRLWKSTDMGVNWTVVANTYHADNHGLFINNSGHIYTATDGGVHVSTDGGVVFNSLTDGIYGTEFIGDFGFSRKSSEVMVGGTMHNGALGKYNNVYANWAFYAGGDLREGYIDAAQNVFRTGTNAGGNQISRSKDGGESFSLLSTTSKYIITHPNTPSILYSPDNGQYNLWKSIDDGEAWTKITNFSTTTSVNIVDVDICESSPDNIVLNLKDDKSIAVSADGGQTWTTKAIPVHGSRKVNDLIIDHTDPLTMWIVYDKQYVYKTTDGGDNWTTYNTGIDATLSLNCITNHVGSNGAVYLGGENMVYYRDNSLSSWTSFATGLPTAIEIRDIEVIYDINKIRISSNRSLWESDLNSTASPKAAISASVLEVSDCDNLAIQYYDASFVPTAGTTWNWTFPGGTPASSTAQNPIISYTTSGTFDVTLQVTNGSSDTRTVTDLITVNTIPTTALPVNESIENFTYSGKTGGCSPAVTLSGSLTNLYGDDFADANTYWRVNSGTGISTSSGPIVDYSEGTSAGQYLYLRSLSGCGERTAAMITDCFDFNGLTTPTLTFAYQAIKTNGVAAPELHIDVSSNGTWTTDVLEVLGEKGARNGDQNDWVVFNVDLSAYANTIVKIRIWGTSSTNGTVCDLALDGIQVYDLAALPVEWLSFSARLNDKKQAVLDWQTASETNSDKFIVQKSNDGTTFENIATIKAAGNSSSILDYTYLDETPFQGLTYYRLQQLDLDGKIEYSSIKTIQLEAENDIQLYPNPLITGQQLYIKSDSQLSFYLELFSISGQKILGKQISANQSLDLSDLPKGTYIYKIENQEIGKIGQLLIQ
ncbi:MAG: VPS10 domain-containing protein [Saprospiraceae bacterium]